MSTVICIVTGAIFAGIGTFVCLEANEPSQKFPPYIIHALWGLGFFCWIIAIALGLTALLN